MTTLPPRLGTPGPTRFAPRRGFSFIEIMFAVMILGVGFIMVAGMFPMALSQTQATSDETVGAAIARGGVEYMAKAPYYPTPTTAPATVPPKVPYMDADGAVHAPGSKGSSDHDMEIWNQVKNNLILPDNPRYAFVPLYRRVMEVNDAGQPTTPAKYAQVTVIAVRSRSRSVYDVADLAGPPGRQPTLAAKLGQVTITANAAYEIPDEVVFSTDTPELAATAAAAASGAYLVVAEDQTTPPDQNFNATGWVFRLGVQPDPDNEPNRWELLPGNDTKASLYRPTKAKVYMVGQAVRDPTQPYDKDTNPYINGAQDIAAYTGFVLLK